MQVLAISDGSFRGHGHHYLSGLPDVLAAAPQAEIEGEPAAAAAEVWAAVSLRAVPVVSLPDG